MFMETKKEIFCSYDYFMRHNCRSCKLGRKCEEYENRIKRDRDNDRNGSADNSTKKERQ